MSASSKKKLRKEQNAAQMTEKQRKEQKEAKHLKIYTAVFAVVMALVVVITAVTVIWQFVSRSGVLERSTVAMTVDGTELSNAELSYYYIDLIQQFYDDLYSNYSSNTNLYAMLMYGIDFTSPLSEQVFDEEAGTSWADHFLSEAKESARDTLALAAAAAADGYTLTEEEQATYDANLEYIRAYTPYAYGYTDFEDFLKGFYGNGATEETYVKYYNATCLAKSYSSAHRESLSYDNEDLREAEKEDFNIFSSFSYNTYYLNANSFLEGGTTDADGKTTYSDEEKAAAVAAAEAAAKELTGSDIKSVEDFDAAIAGLSINAEKESVSSTAYSSTLYSSVSSLLRDWVADESRQAGDTTYIANTTTAEDGTVTTNGYYAVYYVSSTDNDFPLVNVRHILCAFEGGTTDDYGTTTYSDEEKTAAYNEAVALLDEWKAGDATEESFAALATEKTDDSASAATGGLYEQISPDSSYVENFLNWCIDDSRKVGDTGIVESDYGYHIMYFVGDDEMTYRDSLITSTLTNRDQSEWYNAIVDAVTVEEGSTSRINKDLVISSSSY